MKRELKVTEVSETGLLESTHSVHFTFNHKNTTYEIIVKQCCTRTITILAPENIDMDKLFDVYYSLKNFLLLLDGQFYQVKDCVEDGIKTTDSFIKHELPCYKSADFMISVGNKLVEYSEALTSEFLHSWCDFQRDLDISFKAMLYCVSSVKMPVDMKCAFAIEAFVPLAELIKNRTTGFILPKVNNNESKLQKYLISIITRYGEDIFGKECDDIKKFTGILRDSRNRIAHIKSKQGKTTLNGRESVMYLRKLSLLYRVILLHLIGIPDNWYRDKLRDRVSTLDGMRLLVSP